MNIGDPTVGIVRFAHAATTPWRNGGGTTRELLVAGDPDGSDAFDWRISIAEVTAAGQFSTFPGIDRVLILCEGEGMVVEVDGLSHMLERHGDVRFAGEQSTSGRPMGGPTLDLNVMTRRDRVRATVTVEDVRPPTPFAVSAGSGTHAVIVVLDGELALATPTSQATALLPFDAVTVPAGAACEITGAGKLARIILTPVHPDQPIAQPDPSGEEPVPCT